MKKVICLVVAGILMGGCAILKPVESKKFGDISKYKYAVIGQTQSLNSSAGSGYVGYGQGDNRSVLGTDNVLGVTIQILDATSHEPLFICSAEGAFGSARLVKTTEADGIRDAITRCLKDF